MWGGKTTSAEILQGSQDGEMMRGYGDTGIREYGDTRIRGYDDAGIRGYGDTMMRGLGGMEF